MSELILQIKIPLTGGPDTEEVAALGAALERHLSMKYVWEEVLYGTDIRAKVKVSARKVEVALRDWQP